MFPTNITQINVTKILNWLKHQIPIYIFVAIKTLLRPCCEIAIDTITYTCTSTGVGTVSVKILGTFSYPHPITSYLLRDNVIVSSTGTYDGINTFTFTGVTLANSSASWEVLALLQTSTDGNVGVYQNTVAVTSTPPLCS